MVDAVSVSYTHLDVYKRQAKKQQQQKQQQQQYGCWLFVCLHQPPTAAASCALKPVMLSLIAAAKTYLKNVKCLGME